jgi:3-hydroxybutyryl-CoA dehydrogenase
MTIQRVGVLGAGLMGSGIAQVCAAAGYQVMVLEVSDELIRRGLGVVEKSLARFAAKGAITAAQQEEAMARLAGTTRPEDLAEVDLVIEAIVEDLGVKREIYARLDGICRPAAVFASNTSSLSITEMLTATSPERRRRFVGLHFFNPVPLMKLVEAARTILTDEAVYAEAVAFAESLGKTVVRTSDRTGFIVNRLLVPYLLDAVRALEEGAGSVADIDLAMKLGCGHPMGPLALLDFVGLDTTYFIANIMFEEFRERRFAPPPLLKRLVTAGLHGRKSGRGFYDYADPQNPRPSSLE